MRNLLTGRPVASPVQGMSLNSKKRLLLSTSLVHEAVLPASNDIYKWKYDLSEESAFVYTYPKNMITRLW